MLQVKPLVFVAFALGAVAPHRGHVDHAGAELDEGASVMVEVEVEIF